MVDVLRVGPSDGTVEVSWKTQDIKSAVMTDDYLKTSGRLTFGPGETNKSCRVKLIDNDAWEPDEMFEVVLFDPVAVPSSSSSSVPPPPALAVSNCCVTIIDNDAYPQRCPADATPLRAFFFFILERFQQRGDKVTTTAWCFVYKAFHEVALTTFALVYFFKFVKQMSKDVEKGRDVSGGLISIGVCVAVLAVSTFIYQHADFEQLDKRGRSGTRKDLRQWIVGRQLQASAKVRRTAVADEGHVLHAAVMHVEEAVNKGWFSLFLALEGCSAMVFILCMSAFLGGPVVLAAAFINVTGVALIVAAREKQNVKLAYVRAESEDTWVAAATEAMLLRTEKFRKDFNTVYEDFYKKHRKHRKFFLGTQWRCRWWVSGMYYFILFFGAYSVAEGALTVAALAGMVKLAAALSKYSLLIAKSLSSLQQASVSLSVVREIMDLDTEGRRKMLMTASGSKSQEERHDSLISPSEFTFPEIAWLAIGMLFNTNWAGRGVKRAKRLKKLMRKLSEQMEEKAEKGKQVKALDKMYASTKIAAAHLTTVIKPDDSDAESEDLESARDPEHFSGLVASERWVARAVSDPTAFHRISLVNVSLSVDLGVRSVVKVGIGRWQDGGDQQNARGKREKIIVDVLEDATFDVPLGGFISVCGNLPKRGCGVGRSVILELLCGRRHANSGEVHIPPHLKIAMLSGTSPINAIAARSLRDNLLVECDDPSAVDDDTVRAACELAGLSTFLIDRLDYPCTLRGANLREVDRVHVIVARTFLSGPSAIGINRTDGILSAQDRDVLHTSLRRWVEEGVPPSSQPRLSVGGSAGDDEVEEITRKRTPNEVIAAANRSHTFPGAPPRVVMITTDGASNVSNTHATHVLTVGLGENGTGAAIRPA